MISGLNPAYILLLGALLVPFLVGRIRSVYMLSLPVLGLVQLVTLPSGSHADIEIFSYTLETLRIDHLSFVFGVIFHIAAFLGILYALHVKDTLQHVAALIYAGAALGATFAGDLISLFIYWEITAISSVFLIWARRTERAFRVGMRYLIIQVGSGVILLAGVVVHVQQTGSIDFDHLGLSSVGTTLIFLAFGIKCAFPLLHNWLQDAYPEATVTGTVILSAFTTKLAVYALARSFAGTEILIYIGAIMTAFPIFFAVIENDLRRVLAYSLNNQLGFMVVGVGIGTELALNGTAAHAFVHILYKALLFMSMGAVLYRVGTIKASELGGLYKSMPKTAVFCIIGSMSISAFPLFSGFVAKSMILAAVAIEHHTFIWLVLVFASAGVLDHSGIKIPFFSFFAHDSGKRCEEAPTNMLWAMGITAVLCIGLGVYPIPLYSILPFAVDFTPYDVTHVVTQMQLLLFSAMAFALLFRSGIYPPEIRSLNLDTDWLYRKLGHHMVKTVCETISSIDSKLRTSIKAIVLKLINGLFRTHGPESVLARTSPTSNMVVWVTVLLGALLLFYYGKATP